jgi:adenine-specific DNA methylase
VSAFLCKFCEHEFAEGDSVGVQMEGWETRRGDFYGAAFLVDYGAGPEVEDFQEEDSDLYDCIDGGLDGVIEVKCPRCGATAASVEALFTVRDEDEDEDEVEAVGTLVRSTLVRYNEGTSRQNGPVLAEGQSFRRTGEVHRPKKGELFVLKESKDPARVGTSTGTWPSAAREIVEVVTLAEALAGDTDADEMDRILAEL